MAYATIEDLKARSGRDIPESEEARLKAILEDAAVIIDSVNEKAKSEAKRVVTCAMVLRAINVDADVPTGATQGSMSGLGYAQSWTISSGGAVGELYLTKVDKRILGGNAKIGTKSPLEDMTCME